MEKELLDYCRIKKIFDKGFGFLTSLYYDQNVFFHFSKIRDDEAREKLNNLKRGELYVFYTSEKKEGKRRVKQIWTDIAKIDVRMFPDFIDRLIIEFNVGKTNLYELIHVIKILVENKLIQEEKLSEIIKSDRLLRNATVINALFSDCSDEIKKTVEEATLKFEENKLSISNLVQTVSQYLDRIPIN